MIEITSVASANRSNYVSLNVPISDPSSHLKPRNSPLGNFPHGWNRLFKRCNTVVVSCYSVLTYD